MDTYPAAIQVHTLQEQQTSSGVTTRSIGDFTKGMLLINGSTSGSGTLTVPVHFKGVTSGTTFSAPLAAIQGQSKFLPLSFVGVNIFGNSSFPIGITGLV